MKQELKKTQQIIEVDHIWFDDELKMHSKQDLQLNQCGKCDLSPFQKLSKVRFSNKNPKLCTFIDYKLSRFESDQQSIVNVSSI